jgi:hypothetical protein
MNGRQYNEMNLKEPIDDEYGLDRINAMIADIYAQYAAMGVNVGITHDADVVSTEDENAEDEDGNDKPRPSKRYVNLS